MSAPSIPNLLSLRGASRGGDRGRSRSRGRGLGLGLGGGRGRGVPGSEPGPASAAQAHDVIIQGTDTDAAVSRLSAVELGYLQDPFAHLFVQAAPPGTSARRLPIINRGTYTRTTAIDKLVDAFLAQTEGQQERQIVSLGAGTDTRCLRLFSSQRPAQSLVYHEIDFPHIRDRKLRIVRGSPQLRPVLSDPVGLLPVAAPAGPTTTTAPNLRNDDETSSFVKSWHSQSVQSPSSHLYFHGLDLRHLSKKSQTQPQQDPPSPSPPNPTTISIPHLRTDIPTLLISECCLCYLSVSEAQSVISHFASLIPADLGIVIYEPTRPDDAFGQMMVSNLAARGIAMPTLDAYRRPEDQVARLLQDTGLEWARQMTVDEIWDRWVDGQEKERVDSLEGLDEVEEWKLLAAHYIVAWGWRGKAFSPDV